MLAKAFFGCQRHKNIVNYTIFTRGQYQKNRKNDQKSTKKRPTRTSKTHLQILPSFFPPRTPQKRENPSRLKDFRGGSAAGARPRVAKAMLSFPHYTARHRRIKGLRPLPPTPGHWRGVRCTKRSSGPSSRNSRALKDGPGLRAAAPTA